jgi:hypothetical protein
MATKKEPIPVMLVTFRLPLGTTGRLDEEQTRYRIETVAQYRAVVRKESQMSFIEGYVRNGEKIYVRENGSWCTLTEGSEIVKEELVMVER